MSKRINFFLKHLIISILTLLFILAWIFLIWYPDPLSKAVGVTHIVLMLFVIDMLVGPLLGLIVYKVGKKTLKFDLAIIFLIQILALGYGVFTIAQGRPIWLVYNVDRFDVVRNNDIVQNNLLKLKDQYKIVTLLKPQYVAVKQSENNSKRSDDMFTEIFKGVSISQMPERYIPLKQVKSQIQQRSQKLSVLNSFNNPKDVEIILKQYPQANLWVPLKANAVDMVVLLDKNAEVVKIVDLRPWN